MLKITLSARGTRRLQFFAGLWLWLEALLIWCGPVFILALFLANLSVWGILSALPPVMQLIITLLFWLGAFILWIMGFHDVRWPNLMRVKSRLEQAGKLPHQPLQTLSDQPMRSDPVANVLWQHHQFSAAHDLFRLRWPKLRAEYALRDPYALRWLLLLVFALGALFHMDLAPARLRTAFFPIDQNAWAQLGPSPWHIAITPPEYTGLAPIYLSPDQPLPKPLSIPMDSKLSAHVSGGHAVPRFIMDGETQKFSQIDKGFFGLDSVIRAGDHLKIRQGVFYLLDTPVEIISPQEPIVTQPKFEALPRGRIRVDFCATDRYGLTHAELHWRSMDDDPVAGVMEITIEGKKFCQPQILNLAAEALAGKEVLFWLTVENTAKLTAETDPVHGIMPRYEFKNPWAQKLADARQDYMLHPARADNLMALIGEVRNAKLPVGLYLALENTMREFNNGRENGALADLWQIILRIEEGRYADIAGHWRGEADELLDQLRDWRISESQLQKQLNEAAAAWEVYAPAWGYDASVFDDLWQYLDQLIAAGDRKEAGRMIRQMDIDPGALLDQGQWQSVDPNAIKALAEIRQRLDDPQLTNTERDYLEQLLQF